MSIASPVPAPYYFGVNEIRLLLPSMDLWLQSYDVMPSCGPPGEAPLSVVPGENKLILEDCVILLPLVSRFIGEAGIVLPLLGTVLGFC